jgi:hypothetical protein
LINRTPGVIVDWERNCMRYLKNKAFQRDLNDNHLDDGYVKKVLEDILKGRSTPLGFKMYKIRAAKEGRGKSGGFRNIFFWKRNERIIFCLLFGKNEQDDINADERRALKILSDEYDRLTENEIGTLLKNNQLKEIVYDQ